MIKRIRRCREKNNSAFKFSSFLGDGINKSVEQKLALSLMTNTEG